MESTAKPRTHYLVGLFRASLVALFLGIQATSFGQAATADYDADLLIVGGTESGCAAAVQAARMGVKSIILVNDIEWLGGQFSAEGLCAIDENIDTQGTGMGIRHGHPFPRSGVFKEVVDRIEARNTETFGRPDPGNTRVNTTTRPAIAEQAFRDLLAPYVARGQVRIISNAYPDAVYSERQRVTAVRFRPVENKSDWFLVHARLTIDASDWGDVIRLSGAAYTFGPELKSDYGEPEAPTSRDDYPITDMNPITYTAIIEQTDEDHTIPEPERYDPRAFDSSPYPKDHAFFYSSRRLIDHYGYDDVTSPDVILLCHPNQDYPLDVWPAHVAAALEALDEGASEKNIVEMTRDERQIVFDDAKNRTLQQFYWLQTSPTLKAENDEQRFTRFRLSPEFGTADNLPPKPYIRESLRLQALYMMKQQDTMAPGKDATQYAREMYYDGVGCWQFEYDFHPTRREFQGGDPNAPWMAQFRPLRNWGPPYSGRALLPVRSLVPETFDGLLAAQKNLGYTSIVSSALRLHDQSTAVGQAAGAVAAVCLANEVQPRAVPASPTLLASVRQGLCASFDGGEPALLWPFRDVMPDHPAFEAINLLAARRAFPLTADGIDFRPDEPAEADWRVLVALRTSVTKAGKMPAVSSDPMTRGDFARAWYALIRDLPEEPFANAGNGDADGDGLPDSKDPMPYGHDGVLPIAPAPADGVS